MWIANVGHIVILALAGLLCWAVVSDALTLTIPNRVSIAILALYPAWVIAAWPRVDHPVVALATAAAVLVAGYIAYAHQFIGGGDAKLLAVLALWSGPGLVLQLLIVTALAGGVLAAAILLSAVLKRREVAQRGEVAEAAGESIFRQPIPYGIAIAVGGAAVALRLWAG